MAGVVTQLQQLKDGCWHALSSRFARWTKPLTSSLPLSTLAGLSRSKSELVAENALLRQQLIILKRQVKRPPITRDNRLWGAERIRGELLKLDLRVCKRTIQKYMRSVRTQQPQGQR
jgi:hypothetical protein